MNFVLPLTAIDPTNPGALATVGGKALGLADLITAGMPVPPGFCVTTSAYRHALEDAGAAAQANHTPIVPRDLQAHITAAYAALSADGAPVAVAVRSSATAEDLPTASFAGQQDTYLGVVGAPAVLAAVEGCWASLWNDHAVAYRQRAGIDGDDVAIAVVVQRLVDAQSAGVLFTADPVTGNRDLVVINATWGLGEALVGGEVTPDQIILDAATGEVVRHDVADKHVMTIRSASGSALVPVADEHRRIPVLADDDLGALLRLATAVSTHTGHPMDIEWAKDDTRIWAVQARPITALPPDLMGMEWSREMIIERYPDPVTPMTWSTVSGTFFDSLTSTVRSLGGTLPTDVPLLRLIHGRVYVNVTAFQRGMNTLPLRPPVATKDAPDPSAASTASDTSNTSDVPVPAGRPKPAALARGLTALVRVVLGTHREWERRLPAYIAANETLRHVDWEAMTATDLLTDNAARRDLLAPMLDNHARAIVAGDLTLQLLGTLTKRWLDDSDGSLVLTLVSGLTGNHTVETNHELWLLAEHARRHGELRDLLTGPAGPDRTAGDLTAGAFTAVPGGADFASRLAAFLERYGHRSPRYEFHHPTWGEDPTQVLDLIRLMLDGVPDPLVGQRAAEARRHEATADARRRLALPQRLIFDRVLNLAQVYFRLRENQQFYLVLGTPGLRGLLAAIGARFVEHGLIDGADDVYFLHHDEVIDLLTAIAAGRKPGVSITGVGAARSTRDLISQRRAQFFRDHTLAAPLRLGGAAEDAGDDAAGLDGALRGIPASAGTATGRARIVRGPEDFASVCRGDILVAPATTPAWTPLFGVAAGLVTEFGGLLSHSGVVAREYGMPAVLGVPDALTRIADGDVITIDGGIGVVHRHAAG